MYGYVVIELCLEEGLHSNWFPSQIDVRYMVDIATYRKMHPTAAVFLRRLRDELGPEKMAQDEPPGGEFLLLLPAHVYGFNMQEKKWGII